MSERKITPRPVDEEAGITAETIEEMFPGGEWIITYDEDTGAPQRTYRLRLDGINGH